MTSKVRVLLSLSAAALLAACGGTGDDHADRVGEVSEELAPAGSNATVVSASNFTNPFLPGERRVVQVTMQNTGVASPANDWTVSSPIYQLGTKDGAWAWGWTPVPQRTTINNPATFTFIVTAPQTLGVNAFRAQMRVGSADFFGAITSGINPTIATGVQPDWGCQEVSDNLPTSGGVVQLSPSQSFAVSITVTNIGRNAWAKASTALSSRDTPVNFWNQTLVYPTADVAPGTNTTFNFNIVTPATEGTYSFAREMKTFGTGPGDFRNSGFCVQKTIQVTNSIPRALNAQVVSATFTTPINTSDFGDATVVMKNTGTETWTAGTTYVLYSQNSPANLWNLTQVAVPADTPTNQNATFTFGFKAPATPNTYNQVWQMRKLSGTNPGFFGQQTNVPIVVNMGQASFDATVVSQNIPPLMTVGKPYTFTIQMRNAGSSAWSGTKFSLFTTNTPSTLWTGFQSVLGASETINPNSNKTFTIAVTAPATPGTYTSSWRMKSTDIGLFGATALQTGIVVTNCGNSVVDAGETCDDGNLNDRDGCSSTCQQEQTVIDEATDTTSRTLIGSGLGMLAGAATVGDVTGDGTPEIFTAEYNPPTAIGAPARNAAGAVYGYTGASASLNSSTTTNPSGAGISIAGAEASDGLGYITGGRVAIGEVTGDSIQDLIVSAGGADGAMNARSNCGEVFVFAGGSSLMSAGLVDLKTSTLPVAHITGANASDGLAIITTGDVTGDGRPDLVLFGGTSLYIVSGGTALRGEIDLAGTPPSGVTVTTITGTSLGPVAAVGDLNGDGKQDIIVGAPLAAPGGRTRSGAAYAAFGPITGNLNFSLSVGASGGPAVAWLGQNAFDELGISAVIGNVTGTSANEALIGGIQYQRSAGVQSGGVHIWSGVTASTTYDESAGATPTVRIVGADQNDDCGTALALGDMNADMYQDIVFSCSAADGPGNTRSKAGEIDVVLGAASLPATYDLFSNKSRLVLYGETTDVILGRYPTALSVADMNGDGKADFCAGTTLGGGTTNKPGRVDCVKSPF